MFLNQLAHIVLLLSFSFRCWACLISTLRFTPSQSTIKLQRVSHRRCKFKEFKTLKTKRVARRKRNFFLNKKSLTPLTAYHPPPRGCHFCCVGKTQHQATNKIQMMLVQSIGLRQKKWAWHRKLSSPAKNQCACSSLSKDWLASEFNV